MPGLFFFGKEGCGGASEDTGSLAATESEVEGAEAGAQGVKEGRQRGQVWRG